MKNIKLKHVAMLFLMTITFSTQAQDTPNELRDMVGMKAAYLDDDLSNRGYKFIKNQKSNTDSYSYYWNNNKSKCITTRTNNGRVASIVSTPSADCGKNGNNSYTHHDYGYSQNHQNDNEKQSYRRGYHDGHKRTKNNNYSSQIQMNAYDQGYRDGYGNKPMDSYYAKDDYSNTHQYYNSYNHNNNGNNSNSGNHNNNSGGININELKGMKSKAAYASLEQKGFSNTKTFQEDDVTYKLWYNSKSDQCVKTFSKNYYIARIENSNNCK